MHRWTQGCKGRGVSSPGAELQTTTSCPMWVQGSDLRPSLEQKDISPVLYVEWSLPCLFTYVHFRCYDSLTASKFPSGLFLQLENFITLLDVQVCVLLAQLCVLKWSWWIFIFEGFHLVCGFALALFQYRERVLLRSSAAQFLTGSINFLDGTFLCFFFFGISISIMVFCFWNKCDYDVVLCYSL